jgi:hypothetical protein
MNRVTLNILGSITLRARTVIPAYARYGIRQLQDAAADSIDINPHIHVLSYTGHERLAIYGILYSKLLELSARVQDGR